MKLILNNNDFKHIEEKSSYNHNYFVYIGSVCARYTEILEICHEDYNFNEYFLIKENAEIFLGCSEGYGLDNLNSIIEIDFQLYYT